MRVAVYGLGRIGSIVARAIEQAGDLELAAGIVTSAEKVGRPLRELAGIEESDLPATGDARSIAADPAIDAVVYCGLGDPQHVAGVLGMFADGGKIAVTTTGLIHPPTGLGEKVAAELHARAVRSGGRIVGAGWNPGFLLDLLPVVWVSLLPRVELLEIRRAADIGHWGSGVLATLGIGSDAGNLIEVPWRNVVPLHESLNMILAATGFEHADCAVQFEHLVAGEERVGSNITVMPGQVKGFRLTATATSAGAAVVDIESIGVVGVAEEPGLKDMSQLTIHAGAELTSTVSGSFMTDPYPATAGRAVNVLAPLSGMPPGLYRPDQVPFSSGPVAP